MNQALDAHKIRSFLGDDIYHQAIDLLQMGHLKQINFNDRAVHVEVQGNDIYPHTIEIELENEKLSTISCSCNTHGLCVHMGVAVIHYARIKKKIPGKFLKILRRRRYLKSRIMPQNSFHAARNAVSSYIPLRRNYTCGSFLNIKTARCILLKRMR